MSGASRIKAGGLPRQPLGPVNHPPAMRSAPVVLRAIVDALPRPRVLLARLPDPDRREVEVAVGRQTERNAHPGDLFEAHITPLVAVRAER